MTPEINLILPMYGGLFGLLTTTSVGENIDNCNELFDTIFSITKLISFGDVNGVNREIMNYYASLNNKGINISSDELNIVIRESSLSIMKELMVNDLIDYIHYVVDFSAARIVIRAYKLDTSVDVNKGVEIVF